MSSNENEELDAYLRRELTDPEQSALEARLAVDEALRDELAWRTDLVQGVRVVGRAELRNYLQQVEQRAAAEAAALPAARRRWLRWAAVAAVGLLLVVSTYLLWLRPLPSDALFQSYFDPYPNVVAVVERGPETPREQLALAMRRYEAQQYAPAAQLLEEMLRTYPENDTLHFYLGNCYLATSQPARAADHFRHVIGAEKRALTDQARWYLALAFVAQGERSEARRALETLMGYENFYKIKARDLNGDL